LQLNLYGCVWTLFVQTRGFSLAVLITVAVWCVCLVFVCFFVVFCLFFYAHGL